MTSVQERTAFFAALGEALDIWAGVELELYVIFLGCLSPADHRVAAAVYYGTEGFRTKLKLTAAAVQTALEGRPVLGQWAELYDYVRDTALTRNALAHRDVLHVPDAQPGRRYLLVEPVLNSSRRSDAERSQGGLGTPDLEQAKQLFAEARIRLRNFHAAAGRGGLYYVRPAGEVATR